MGFRVDCLGVLLFQSPNQKPAPEVWQYTAAAERGRAYPAQAPPLRGSLRAGVGDWDVGAYDLNMEVEKPGINDRAGHLQLA